MRSVKLTIGVALALMAVTAGVLLSRSPLTVAATNSVVADDNIEITKGNVSSCQAGSLPQGTSAIRIALEARAVGPAVSVKVLEHSHVLTEGAQAAGWGVAPSVTVPVTRVSRAVRNALICVTVGSPVEPFRVRGTARSATAGEAHELSDVTLRMEYLRPGPNSWWSLASSVAHRMGLGRAPGGTWVVFLVLALMLAVAGLASRVVWGELR